MDLDAHDEYEYGRSIEPPFKRRRVACCINSQDGSVSVSGSELRDDLSDCSDDEPSEQIRHYNLIIDLLERPIKEGSDAAAKATVDVEEVTKNALVARKGMKAKTKKIEIETKMKRIVTSLVSPSQVALWVRKLETEYITDPHNHAGIALMIKEKPILYDCKCSCGEHYEYKDTFGEGDLSLLCNHILDSQYCKALSTYSLRDSVPPVKDDYPYEEKPFPLSFFRMTRMRESVNPHKDMLAYMYRQMTENEGSKTFMKMNIQKTSFMFNTFFSKRSVGLEARNSCDRTESCSVIYKEDRPELFENTVESQENLCKEIIKTFAEFAESISLRL
jgi:hypothetical protein